jgi:RHS repeat-associated protein
MQGWSYDAAGNLLNDGVHSYTYDAECRIKTVDGTAATYTYGPGGERVRKDTPAGSTEYINFGGSVIAELNPASGAWTDYIFAGGSRIAKDTSTNGSGAQYFQGDSLGSTRIMTDATGAVISSCTYAPYGEQVACSPDNTSNHYRFTGKERDTETGIDYFGARHYSSRMGRFMTPDWDAGPTTVPYAHLDNPQTLNLYSYVDNNPINGVDPTGHSPNEYMVGGEGWGANIFEGSGWAIETDIDGTASFSIDSQTNMATLVSVQINSVTQTLTNDLSGRSDLQSMGQPGLSSTLEDKTSSRHLSGYEKGKLNPFLPKVDLDKAMINIGKTPHYGVLRFPFPKDAVGVTVNYNIFFRKGAYDPGRTQGIALLAHELFHVDQYRTGVMTPFSYVREALRHGSGMENKYEAPAYEFEQAVERQLSSTGRAWDGSLLF